MSYFRVSTVSATVALSDLGITIPHPTANFVMSNQFKIEDLQGSLDLVAAITGGSLTAEVNLDGNWTAVVAANFSADEIYAAAGNIYEIVTTPTNEELVKGGNTALHKHDQMYHTKTELNGTGGAGLVGVNSSAFTIVTGVSTTQAAFAKIDELFTSRVTLDWAYANDTDGILDVNGAAKELNLRSNNVNDIVISRKSGVDQQDVLRADVSANELILGSTAVGALGACSVRIRHNLIIDGDLTFTGTITDQTVNNLNVSNEKITLREGASVDADGFIQVNRPVAGANASVKWNETTDRWQAGVDGSEQTMALLERNEVVTGIYEMQGPATAPNMYMQNKVAAPTTGLGTANQIGMQMINNVLAVYDKSNSRNKWLSVYREQMLFTGRDANNSNEYARTGQFSSMTTGIRLGVNMTLIGIAIQTGAAHTWTAEVRKNGSATVVASLAATAAAGAQTNVLNVDFNAGDQVQVYINGSNINRPSIKLIFAERF